MPSVIAISCAVTWADLPAASSRMSRVLIADLTGADAPALVMIESSLASHLEEIKDALEFSPAG